MVGADVETAQVNQRVGDGMLVPFVRWRASTS